MYTTERAGPTPAIDGTLPIALKSRPPGADAPIAMEILVLALLAFALGAAVGASVVVDRRRREQADLERLADFMMESGPAAFSRRVPDELGGALGHALNHLLDALAIEYKVADRRGKEWERAVDALDELVAVLDSQGRVVRANRALADRVGIDVRQLKGLVLEEILYAGRAAARESGPIAVTRTTGRPADARVDEVAFGRPLRVVTNPVVRDYGEAMTCVVMRTLEPERREDREARLLGELAASMPVPVVLADPVSGEIRFANDAFRRAFGYRGNEALSLDTLPLERDEPNRLALRSVALDEGVGALQMTLVRKDGRPLETFVYGSAHRDERGAPDALMIVIQRAQPRPGEQFTGDLPTIRVGDDEPLDVGAARP